MSLAVDREHASGLILAEKNILLLQYASCVNSDIQEGPERGSGPRPLQLFAEYGKQTLRTLCSHEDTCAVCVTEVTY